MILDFNLVADAERAHVTVPQAGIDEEFRALMGYNVRTGHLVSIGDTAEEMRMKAPEYWERYGEEIVFVRVFDFYHPAPAIGKYEPLIAARLLQYYANRAWQRTRFTGFWRQLLAPFTDHIHYHLQMAGYDWLAETDRRAFVRHLRANLPVIGRLEINGEAVR